MIFEGAISVKSLLEHNYHQVVMLYMDKQKDDRNTRYIVKLANQKGIKINYCTRSEIDALSSGKTHGGILAESMPRTYQKFEDIKGNRIACIDGIEDPFNLGYAFRSLYCFGFSAVILKRRDFDSIEHIILKSSAGAFNKLAIYFSDDITQDLKKLKTKQYNIFSMQRSEQAQSIYEIEYTKKMVLVVGGEKRGIAKEVLALSDTLIYIPYGNEFKNALNATSAISSVASEIHRQDLIRK